MKKTLFPVLVYTLLAAGPVYGQIEVKQEARQFNVGEVKTGGAISYKLYGIVVGEDTTYSFMYRNAKYTSIVDFNSIQFADDGGTLQQFYTLLKSVLTDEKYKDKEAKLQIRLGATDVILSQYKMMGTTYVWVWTNTGYCYLSEKQINKLFGKSKNDE